MTEQEAIELLGKLEKFMRDTASALKTLDLKVYNLKVEIDNIKKQSNQNKILVRN